MALNEVLGLILPFASTCLAWPHPRQASGAAVALHCQSVAAGSAPGPARLTSPWRRSKQNLNTDDTLKAYLTDIMCQRRLPAFVVEFNKAIVLLWIKARSLVLLKLEIWNQDCPPCPWAAAVTTFIGCSIPCQTRREAKSLQNITVALTPFRPSGRTEGQEAGAVSGAGTWPVQPAAAPAAPTAPGKPYRMLYRKAYDVEWSYRLKNSTLYLPDIASVVVYDIVSTWHRGTTSYTTS
jgi:hypothetical protein